ncbi:acylphosphatase [Leucobacter chinensis]|uniref:acylphosphatase n=1 Tax=Leucobacter chinensis TaxID=2851010 RepID=UPI001C21AA35|nr:acylphosphatase [Leucobacter chinensis]
MQNDLQYGGQHILLTSSAWDAAESALKGLPGLKIAEDNLADVLKNIDGCIDIELEHRNSSKKSKYNSELIMIALEGALRNLTRGETTTYSSLEEFYLSEHERIQKYAVEPAPSVPLHNGEEPNTYTDLDAVSHLPRLGTPSYTLIRDALQFGLQCTLYPNSALIVTHESGKALSFKASMSPLTSAVARAATNHKEATRVLLQRAKVPVPLGRVFSIEDRSVALDFADSIGYPVVCKPVAGFKGIGVVSNIRNREELEKALDLHAISKLRDDDLIIERHVTGDDYRIVVIDRQVVAGVLRSTANVVGDGLHTVADLVFYKNRALRANPQRRMSPIKISHPGLHYQLGLAGYTLASVPAMGEKVLLASSANLSLGGDSIEILDELHPSIQELAIKAVDAVPGLDYCGVDMLIEDHRLPAADQSCTIIELNSAAAMGSAQYPMWGNKVQISQLLMEASAHASGLQVEKTQNSDIAITFTVRGRVTGVGYRRWIQSQAKSLSILGHVKNLDKRTVTAFAQGRSDDVAALVRLAILGPEGAVPTSVAAEPAETSELTSFEVRK